jgi:hypothetical protein
MCHFNLAYPAPDLLYPPPPPQSCTEPVFVNLFRSPGIDSQPGEIDSWAPKRLQIRSLYTVAYFHRTFFKIYFVLIIIALICASKKQICILCIFLGKQVAICRQKCLYFLYTPSSILLVSRNCTLLYSTYVEEITKCISAVPTFYLRMRLHFYFSFSLLQCLPSMTVLLYALFYEKIQYEVGYNDFYQFWELELECTCIMHI